MRDWYILIALSLTAIVAVFLLAATPLEGQARGPNPQGRGAPQPPAYTPPKNALGQPDLSGIWQVLDTSLAYGLDAHTAWFGAQAGQGAVVDPPNGMIPYLPAALAKRRENFRNRAALDPINKCYKPGVPRINFLHLPFQIMQTAQQVTFIYEYIHNTRPVHLNRKTHLEGVDFWNGDAIGRFEGNTLVVDIADFNDQTWFDASGNYHSEALKIEERYTRTEPDIITYEVTITDPKVFSRPWKLSTLLYRHKERNFKVLEYECHAYAQEEARQRSGK